MKNKYLYITLIFVVISSFGIHNADLPFGDEPGYISKAYSLYQNKTYTSNTYILSYILLFEFLTDDPIIAHYILRFITSFLSVFLMYFFLKSFNFIRSEFAILLSLVFWSTTRLVSPIEQIGNINLFSLTLILPSLTFLIRKITITRLLFFILSLLWASFIRPEYYAPLVLVCMWTPMYLYIKRNSFATFYPYSKYTYLLAMLIVISLPMRPKELSISLDQYLLLGLNQCYASLYSKLNPDKKLSPMVEYSSITDKVFKKPTGFIDACKKNPIELSKYLLINGTLNSITLIPGILRHKSIIIPDKYGKKGEIIQILIALSIFSYGTIIYFLKNKFRRHDLIAFLSEKLKDYRIAILIILPSAASVAILLLIPDPRYWISFIPILFVWITWSLSNLLEHLAPHKQKIVCFSAITVLSWPTFAFHSSNNILIHAMRQSNKKDVPSVGGLFPHGIAFFAFKDQSSVVAVDRLSPEMISQSKLDYIVVDKYFRNSSFWQTYKEAMDTLEDSPEKLGYYQIARSTNKHETAVYSKIPIN